MKKFISSCRPAFTRRFWFKLTLVYTVVSIVGIKSLISVFDTIIHYQHFNEAMQPSAVLQTVTERLKPIRRLIASAALDTQDIADAPEIIDDLMMRENLDDNAVADHLRSSSDPTASYVVFDENDRPIAQHLMRADERVIALLMTHRAAVSGGEALVPEHLPHSVFINIPLSVREPTKKGRIALLITAKFSIAKQFYRDEDWVSELMPFVITLCIVMSGYLASKNFIRRLRHITSVSSAWREGDLDQRIIDNDADELSEHSHNLNIMVGQLKELLGLKQQAAIQDERTRMARELHDTVKQNLFALALQLAAISSKAPDLGEAKQNLLESRLILKQAQEQLVGVIAELRIISPEQEGSTVNLLTLCENLESKLCAYPLRRSAGFNAAGQPVFCGKSRYSGKRYQRRTARKRKANCHQRGQISNAFRVADNRRWHGFQSNAPHRGDGHSFHARACRFTPRWHILNRNRTRPGNNHCNYLGGTP